MRVSDEAASSVLQRPPEQSAWLQTTEWVRYLQGRNLGAAAWLIALPHSSSKPEPDLVAILDSFDRLVEQARESIKQGKINAFDQQRINSFLRSGSRTSKASDRPLAHRLKEGTYRTYKKIWKQLLCFVFRMVYQGQQPALHCLTLLLVRTSIILLLFRVASAINSIRIALYIILAFNTGSCLGPWLALIFMCPPRPGNTSGATVFNRLSCLDPWQAAIVYVFIVTSNMFTDLLVFPIPCVLVWRLRNTKLRSRLAVVLSFALSLW